MTAVRSPPALKTSAGNPVTLRCDDTMENKKRSTSDKVQRNAAFDMGTVRQEIFTYCDSLPRIIRTHGGGHTLGCVALNLGKCFKWIGPVIDKYSYPTALAAELPRVTQLGEELRLLGLDLINKPDEGEINRTISTLEKQIDLLKELKKGGVL